MLENQCTLEILDPQIVDREIVNPDILNPDIVSPEIVNLEIMNFVDEGAIRRRVEIEDTSDRLMKDLREGFVWTQG